MPKRKKLKPFAAYVDRKTHDARKNQTAFAKIIGRSQPTISREWGDNRFPDDLDSMRILAEFLKVPLEELLEWRNKEYSEEDKVLPAPAYERLAPSSTVEGAVEKIDDTLRDSLEALRKIAPSFEDVFKRMGQHDFFISSTITSKLLLMTETGTFFDSRMHAIKNGARCAFIMPSKKYLKRIARYGINTEGLIEGWNSLRQRACEWMGRNDKDPEWFDTHMQMFESDELPLTRAGVTVSLLGFRTSTGSPVLRTIIRGRIPNVNSLLLFPESNQQSEQWMLRFALTVISDQERRSSKDWARVEFIERFKEVTKPYLLSH